MITVKEKGYSISISRHIFFQLIWKPNSCKVFRIVVVFSLHFWCVPIHKFKTWDSFCQNYFTELKKNLKLAVLFRDASFNHASKGSPTSQGCHGLKKRLEQNHGITCIETWEFNTSQICSHCHSPEKTS